LLCDFFLLSDDVVYLEQCFLKADNGFSCLQAFGFQDIKIRQTAHYSAANDLPGLKNCVFRLSFHSPFTIFDYLCIDDC